MKRKAVGAMLTMMVLMSATPVFAANNDAIQPMANCTSWVFHQEYSSCTDPLCGPGAVLKTKYLHGYRSRYCNDTGEEKQPYTKKQPGCC